jgi:phage-related protein
MSGSSSNLFQELHDALTQFKQFIEANQATLKTAVTGLKSIVPQVGDLLTKLIALMGQLKDAVNNLNVGAIPGLDKVSQFTTAVTSLLQTAEALLPQQKSAIDDVLSAANVVTGLLSLDAIKQEILDLLSAVVTDLQAVNA